MTEQEYIGLINLVGGVMAIPLVWMYARWIWKDAHNLLRISAGLLVFVFLLGMLLRGYESFYYGVARFLNFTDSGIDIWRDQPWITLIASVRTLGLVILCGGFAAKRRADGYDWRKTGIHTAIFAGAGVTVGFFLYLALLL